MKTFIEWLFEATNSTWVNFILKNWRSTDPQIRRTVLHTLQGTAQTLEQSPRGIENPYYLEIIGHLDEILPGLLNQPDYKKAAQHLQGIILADKAEMEKQGVPNPW